MLDSFWSDMVRFSQKLIQTPSLSGEEDRVADLIQAEMKKLSYDEVETDRVGNVIGLIKGNPELASICFTAHMDHVDTGDEKEWKHHPYAGIIDAGFLYGRGASDLKGVIATQVYIAAALKSMPVEHGDIYIVEVVHEEMGGLGTKSLDKGVLNAIDYAVNGEPTSNNINIAHKGRVEIVVSFKGNSVHASMPGLGVNPLYDTAGFITELSEIVPAHNELEKSTFAPTLCYTDQESANVTPGEVNLVLDWRNIASEPEAEVLRKIKNITGVNGSLRVASSELKTYTGIEAQVKRSRPPFYIQEEHPLVREAASAVSSVLQRKVEINKWSIATDCGILMDAGIPTIGFSPGEEISIHTNKEKISLSLIKEAMYCYPVIIANVAKLERRNVPKEEYIET